MMRLKATSRSRRLRSAAAALCAALLLAGCKTEVYQGLSETQANAMMAVLMKNGIVPAKTSDKTGYILSVESRQVAQTLELMRENNLPRPNYENMGEIFAAKGMISSATEERARMTYALSQELSETFSQIDGVLTSRVHVVLGSEDLGTGKSTPASAAVFLRYTPDSQAPNLVARIKVLTANAVPGLSQDNVSVMLVPVRETVTLPLLDAKAAGSIPEGWLLYAAAGLFSLSLAGLGGAGWLYWQTRRRRDESEREDAKGTTGRSAV